MAKIEIHTDDLPRWAVRKEKVPRSYLDCLTEAVYPAPDGKGMISAEEIMVRQQFDAALKNNSTAMTWLLRKIIAENDAKLAAFDERPAVVIEGVHYFYPLAPVLAILVGSGSQNAGQGPAGGSGLEEHDWPEAAADGPDGIGGVHDQVGAGAAPKRRNGLCAPLPQSDARRSAAAPHALRAARL